MTLSKLIDRYVEEYRSVAKWGRTKQFDLTKLKGYDIAEKVPRQLTSDVLVEHVRRRRALGVSAPTALNDLVWIGVVLRAAKGAWRIDCDPNEVAIARELCTKTRLVGKARQRDRLPTNEELEKLDAYFARADLRADIPMRQIMWFAIHSARRQDEITRITWSDNDDSRQMGWVRDAKHPTAKEGNHKRCRYAPEAWAIIQRQERVEGEDRIFPYNGKSISARFTRACSLLGIPDLHFHDLRHEATTRLFERGLAIQEVATYTLHDSWAVLKRYTHLQPRAKVLDAPFLKGASPSGFPQ